MKMASFTASAGQMILAPLAVIALFAAHLNMGAYSDAAGVALAAAWAILLAIFGLRGKGVGPGGGALLLWIAAACYAVVAALPAIQWFTLPDVDHEYLLAAGVRLFGLFAACSVGLALGRRKPAQRLFVRAFLWASILFAVLSLLLFALGADLWNASTVLGADRRLAATFFAPNTAALHFGFCAFVALAAASAKLARAWRREGGALDKLNHFLSRGWLELLSLGLSLTCLGMTGSRMGLASAIAAVLVFAVCNVITSRRGTSPRGRGQTVALALLGVTVIGAATVTLTRLADVSEDLRVRTMMYQSHWPFVTHSGPIGFGFGSFHAVNSLATTQINFPALSGIGGLHDVYLQWLEQAGPVGSIAMLATMLLLTAALVRLLARRGSTGIWAQAAVAMSVFAALHDVTDFGLEFYSMTSEWALILGLVIGIGLNAENPATFRISKTRQRSRLDIGNNAPVELAT